MKATIELATTDPYYRPHARDLNLLHALLAIHDGTSHDADKITFPRDDGFSLHINLTVNCISFGEAGRLERERVPPVRTENTPRVVSATAYPHSCGPT